MDTWQNGCFHTIPNHHPPKMDVLPKVVLQIILSAKWQVQQLAFSSILNTFSDFSAGNANFEDMF